MLKPRMARSASTLQLGGVDHSCANCLEVNCPEVPWRSIPWRQSDCILPTVEHVVKVRVVFLDALARESPPVLATPINGCAVISFQAASLRLHKTRTSSKTATCAEGVAAALVQTLPVIVCAASFRVMARLVLRGLDPAVLLRTGLADDSMIFRDVMVR